jgi:hypothetical protein
MGVPTEDPELEEPASEEPAEDEEPDEDEGLEAEPAAGLLPQPIAKVKLASSPNERNPMDRL